MMDFELGGRRLQSRLLIGTARYPTPRIMQDAIRASGADIVTVSLRRAGPDPSAGAGFWKLIAETDCAVLPNTAGCHTANEAVQTALMARELFETNWVKLEVIGDDYNLQPDPFELVSAARELVDRGFEVFPYCTDDLVLCQRLLDVGCKLLMPWAAPIGTLRGIINPYALRTLRARLPEIPMIVDAGLGRPSHAAQAMELGFDGILLNTAIAGAADPVEMAHAFRQAVEAGRRAYLAGWIPERDLAVPSTPVVGTPFWHQEP